MICNYASIVVFLLHVSQLVTSLAEQGSEFQSELQPQHASNKVQEVSGPLDEGGKAEMWGNYLKRARMMPFHGMRGKRPQQEEDFQQRLSQLETQERNLRSFQALRGKREADLTGSDEEVEQPARISHDKRNRHRAKRHVFGSRIVPSRRDFMQSYLDRSPPVQARAAAFHGLRGKRQQEFLDFVPGNTDRFDVDGLIYDGRAYGNKVNMKSQDESSGDVYLNVPVYLDSPYFKDLDKSDQASALGVLVQLCARHEIKCFFAADTMQDDDHGFAEVKRGRSFNAVRG